MTGHDGSLDYPLTRVRARKGIYPKPVWNRQPGTAAERFGGQLQFGAPDS
jgi:hypothetical protein